MSLVGTERLIMAPVLPYGIVPYAQIFLLAIRLVLKIILYLELNCVI